MRDRTTLRRLGALSIAIPAMCVALIGFWMTPANADVNVAVPSDVSVASASETVTSTVGSASSGAAEVVDSTTTSTADPTPSGVGEAVGSAASTATDTVNGAGATASEVATSGAASAAEVVSNATADVATSAADVVTSAPTTSDSTITVAASSPSVPQGDQQSSSDSAPASYSGDTTDATSSSGTTSTTHAPRQTTVDSDHAYSATGGSHSPSDASSSPSGQHSSSSGSSFVSSAPQGTSADRVTIASGPVFTGGAARVFASSKSALKKLVDAGRTIGDAVLGNRVGSSSSSPANQGESVDGQGEGLSPAAGGLAFTGFNALLAFALGVGLLATGEGFVLLTWSRARRRRRALRSRAATRLVVARSMSYRFV